MIEYDSPHDVDGTPLPKGRLVEAQRALKDSFNSWFAFIKICEDELTHLKGLLTGGHIKPHTYPIIFHFVLCDGSFDPYSLDHLCSLKNENGLKANSIIEAKWCKWPKKRAPNQTTANVKVICASVATAIADVFRKNAISVGRKFAKMLKIFDKIDRIKSRRVI